MDDQYTVASIRMPTSLYEEIKKEAKTCRRSFGQQALYLMELARSARESGQARELAESLAGEERA